MALDEMRKKRLIGESLYHMYCVDKLRYKGKFNCFFEGKDNDYYGYRVRNCVENGGSRYSDIINNISCGSKKDVKYVCEQIKKSQENNPNDFISTSFFIDKDYDDCNNSYNLLYITPCYSIENLYVTLNAFKEILIKIFYMNPGEENFEKCWNDYNKRMREFHGYMIELNAWIYCNIKNKNKDFNMNKIYIGRIFNISLFEEVSLKKYKSILEVMENIFPNIMIDERDFKESICYFEQEDNYKYFRGKFELYFLGQILESIRIEYRKNENGYFSFSQSEFKPGKVNINFDNEGTLLSVLSECADTPDCLRDFIKNQFDLYLANKKD